MDIIDKLKKEKKAGSVFDALLKSKEQQEKPKEETPTTPADIEVQEIKSTSPQPEEKTVIEPKRTQPREFRTEGMHEFDIESLGQSSEASIKIEYKSVVSRLIDEDKIDEAIRLLLELKDKLANKNIHT